MASETQHEAHPLKPRSPAPLRLFNRLGRGLGAGGQAALVPLDELNLLETARQDTGLSDFGDEGFREGLRALLHALETEADLSLEGRVVFRSYLLRTLRNRLNIQRDLTDFPEIRDVQIRRPLFIIGLPRTGSTLLQRLLARDPAARSLATWEMMEPSPPPTLATYTSDPRIRRSDLRMRALNWMAPDFAAVHEWSAGEPEECFGLLQNSLQSVVFEMMAEIPSYGRWLATQDPSVPYHYHHQQLQLLQWRCEKSHWVLKSPVHLFSLESVLDVFPDAVIIQTHRHASRVLPSVCSYFAVMYQLASDGMDPRRIGPVWLEKWAEANDRGLALRDRAGEDRFMDIDARELFADPLACARRIYDRFGYRWTPAAEAAMGAWFAQNPRNKHGVHRYSLEQFGLNEAQVEARFADYHRRFGLQP